MIARDRTATSPKRRASRVVVERVVIVASPDRSSVDGAVLLRAAPLHLGRAPPPGNLTLRDEEVSKRHARIDPRHGGRVVTDLGSRNGTFVNGARVQVARLSPGDVLRLGATLMVFEREELAPNEGVEPEAEPLWGNSGPMGRLRAQLRLAARHPDPVLVLGETGAGKELVARAIHEQSGRTGRFVAVNCGALPGHLIESELFGHAAGAFTGAQAAQQGIFRAARGGTVLLDEIAEMPLALQPKLLRAVGVGEGRAVGSAAPYELDVRFIAATHRDLAVLVDGGEFRRDLYMRLAAWTLRVPALRERRVDVLALAQRFVGDRAIATLDADAAELLLIHDWPGNVRELEHVVRVAFARGTDAIDAETLRAMLGVPSQADQPSTSPAQLAPPASTEDLRAALGEVNGSVSALAKRYGVGRRDVYRWLERFHLDPAAFRDEAGRIRRALEASGGNVSKAASSLGMDRKSIYRIAQRHGIDLGAFKRDAGS